MADNGGFGFKIQGKARPKVAVNVEEKQEQRQLITGVAGSQFQGEEPAQPGKHVIPALQNTYKTGVGKFVPSFVPESSITPVTGNAEDRYERAAAPDQPSITSYGLEVRQRQAPAADRDGQAASGPMVPANSRLDDAAQFKADLELLPEEANVEDYEALPVEEFGKALLRGLGWSDGEGVGKKRQLVEPKQIVRRPDRLGLGANPAAPPPDKRPRKMGEKPREDLVAAPTADGVARHRVGLDEKLVPRSALLPGPRPGKVMRVVAGRHEGLMARVKEVMERSEGAEADKDRVVVELLPSGEVVTVAAADLADKNSTGAAAAAGGSSMVDPGVAAAEPPRGSRGRDDARQQAVGGGSSSRHRSNSEDHNSRERDSRDRDGRHRNSSATDSRHRDGRDGGGRGKDRTDPHKAEHFIKDGGRHGHHSGGREAMGGSRQQHEQSRVRDDVQRQQQKQQQRGESSSATSSDEDDGCAGQGRQQQQQRRGRPTLAPHKLWVAPLTRVRIVDKRIQGGRLYLKKGCVLDVAPDGSCDVRLEEGRQVVTAHQDQLETVVPQEVGAAVMVVQGRHKGRKGRLLQVSLSSGAAALQLVGDLEVVRLLLDDVAQFMGHLEEEDH